jgi:hypothetical protein
MIMSFDVVLERRWRAMELVLHKLWVSWNMRIHPVKDVLLLSTHVPCTHAIDVVRIFFRLAGGLSFEGHVAVAHNVLSVIIETVGNVSKNKPLFPRKVVSEGIGAGEQRFAVDEIPKFHSNHFLKSQQSFHCHVHG